MKTWIVATAAMLAASAAGAAPVNGTGNVTPNVIFGSGNANGSFTGVTARNVELGLRGKLRYNLAGLPENTFNYDGDRTYTFSPAASNPAANRSAFNFEWSINSNVANTTEVTPLNALTYALRIDTDPTDTNNAAVTFDPINDVPFADHAFGDNTTANGGGTAATLPMDYASLIATKNVAQNSWNLGFFNLGGLDPQTQGRYTIGLAAFLGGAEVASTSIDIVYGEVPPIPLPAAAWLLIAGLGGLGLVARRQPVAA